MKISNEEVRKTAEEAKISPLIKKRCWQCIGHALRMDANTHPRIALSWAEEAKISPLIKKRRWQCIGHALRMDANTHPRIALSWTPEGKRKRGRSNETWRRTIEKER